MTARTLPNTSIQTGFTLGESGWNDEYNRNMRVIDAIMGKQVVDKDLIAPPGSPTAGAVYIVGPAPTGAWATHANELAVWMEGDDLTAGWTFVVPKATWRMFVVDEAVEYRYTGSAWASDSGSFASYNVDIGDGTAVEFTVTHNLGTRAVHVTVIRNVTPWDEVVVDVQHLSINTVKLVNFAVAPSAAQFNVIVSK